MTAGSGAGTGGATADLDESTAGGVAQETRTSRNAARDAVGIDHRAGERDGDFVPRIFRDALERGNATDG